MDAGEDTAVASEDAINEGAETFAPGSSVLVRTSLGRWAAGFVVEAREAGRYWLRRRSDGAVLPQALPEKDLAPED